jgi:uncharacterized membrane protein
MYLDNRNITLLLDVLYVPDLGINLLLGQKVCKKGFKVSFNATKLYFKHKVSSKEKVIQVYLTNRIYIITNIASNHKDITFPTITAIDLNKVIFLLLVLCQEPKSKEYYSDNIKDSKTNIKYDSAENKLTAKEKERYY